LSDAGARESVRRILARAARRLRAQRLLADMAPALCAGLAGPALGLLLPAGAARGALALATPVLAFAWLTWRTLRPLPARSAAAWLDRRAGLADALTTACWFLDRDPDDAWVEHQRERAAETARELDLRELVSLRVPPGPALLAAGLAAVVVFGWLRGEAHTRRGGTAAAVADAGVPAPRAEPDEAAIEDGAEAGRDAVPQARPAPADLDALAEELRAGLTEEALERLRELARQAEARRPPGADAATGEGAAEDAAGPSLDAEALASALAEASEAAQRGDEEAAAKALEEASEAAGGPQQRQDPEAPGQPRQASAADQTEAQAPADAGVRWSLDALDPQSAGAEESEQAARGDAAGPPAGGDPEEGEATELDVELEREALSSESARETEPTEITEEASREQSARVGYRGGGGGRYDPPRPVETTEVPWSARERVRLYLLALTQEEAQR